MDYKVVFDNCSLLFDYFGWYSILLVVATTGIMIPINMLYKKLMKTESLERLRKVVSALSVYVIALALIAFFTGVVVKEPITAGYLFSAMLPCGLLAQLLWAVIKVIKDYGIEPIIKSIAQSKEAKQWFVSLGLDEGLVDTIMTRIDNYLKNVNASTLDDVVAQETILYQDLKNKLAGFVDNDNINETATKIIEQVKSKYSNNTTETKTKIETKTKTE